MPDKLRVLVVEDDPKHAEDAKAALGKFDIELVFAATYYDGTAEIVDRMGDGKPKVDGVITDLFIPEQELPAPYDVLVQRRGEERAAKMVEQFKSADQPRGLGVALLAQKLGVPFVICTAGFHHGTKYEWIHDLSSHLGWPDMVDRGMPDPGDRESEAQAKDWTKAWETLAPFINQGR